ncbi:hypothetical protein ABTM64_19845, partial [Acinetobacter baumannii]
NNNLSGIANEIMSAFSAKGVAVNLSFDTPILAGGAQTTPGDYASFLQGMLRSNNPLVMRSLLRPTASDPYAVCTNPYDKTCTTAAFSPVPGNVS